MAHDTDCVSISIMLRADGTVRKTRRSLNIAGHAHELTFCCYRRLPLLSKERTCRWFLEALDNARTRWDMELWAYVIMPEHVHLLLLPRQADYRMANILKAIKQPISRRAIRFLRDNAPDWLPRLEVVRPSGRREYRFWQQGGGYDRNIDNAETAWASADYIHHNPVRRGLVNGAIDWPWSSAREYAGMEGALLRVDACPPDPQPK